jgi:16S rRNA (guanine966-N2)-methyltransferase
MRIIGGTARGLKLADLGAGDDGRPSAPHIDRMREAVFNLLINSLHAPLQGARVLDLFAGTGALGLEALSRGAATAPLSMTAPAPRALLRARISKKCAPWG